MTTASRVSDSRVSDAAKTLIGIVKRRNYSTLVYSPENIEAFTAACVLEAALACEGPVVKVSDLEALRSKIEMEPYPSVYDEGYYDGCRDALMSAIDLTALIAKANGHE